MDPRFRLMLAFGLCLLAPPARAGTPAAPPPRPNPFAQFTVSEEWQRAFWESPNTKALLKLAPEAVSRLVPARAGIRYCRCPNCDTPEAEDPLTWSIDAPDKLTCRVCHVTVPNDKFPAHEDKKPAPADEVEVLPGIVHRYVYHEVEAARQAFPGERLYLEARADHEAREFLARAALYFALRYNEQPAGQKDPALAITACVILVRFAQVYPAYALHFDQPQSLKYFEPATMPPPYRSDYRTGKWCWTASQDVPLNLLVAYAMLRDDPRLLDAGRLVGEDAPARAIERRLFRASADFVRRQPEEFTEATLAANRGILAVGRVLGDEALIRDSLARLDRFSAHGFYYDGLWRRGTLASHRRVVRQLDGWIDQLVKAGPAGGPSLAELPMLALAHHADDVLLINASPANEVVQAGWPAATSRVPGRLPALLGGAGIARLAVGQGDSALDLELRSLDANAPDRIQRQALRVAVGGRPVLGDLDDAPSLRSGFQFASASHNTVVVDGLNQRESLPEAAEPAPAGDFTFFAADPDFQVATLEDRRAYPRSTRLYRQTLIASAGPHSRYAVSLFEVEGGLQHEQLFHTPPGLPMRWRLSVPRQSPPADLLPPSLTFVPNATADQGRWFVQAFGEFAPLDRGLITRPAMAMCEGVESHPERVRLHILGDTPITAFTAASPDPAQAGRTSRPDEDNGRGSLILRRRSPDGGTLQSVFVTLIEPIAPSVPGLARVGRAASPPGTVVLYIESADGPEHLVVNLAPGTTRTVLLSDGRTLSTDGLAVRVTGSGLILAGGSYASCGGKTVRHDVVSGTILASQRRHAVDHNGWFVADHPLHDAIALEGRTLIVKHGDGSTHGWTIHKVQNFSNTARILVREEPGFQVEPRSGEARFYQFPETTFPGPHTFQVSRIAR